MQLDRIFPDDGLRDSYLNAILSTETYIAVQARPDELGLTAAAKQ